MATTSIGFSLSRWSVLLLTYSGSDCKRSRSVAKNFSWPSQTRMEVGTRERFGVTVKERRRLPADDAIHRSDALLAVEQEV